MPKLDYLQQKRLSPADELREILNRLEEQLPKIKTLNGDQALSLLQDLDQATELYHHLEMAGLDLAAETGRFQSLQARLRRQAGALLKSLGGPAAFTTQRPVPAPPPEQWWWYLNELVAQRQQRLRRQIGLIVVVILGAIAGIIILFQTVLAPSPEVLARLEAENKAYAAMDTGNFREALTAVEHGLSKVPADPNLLLLHGVIQETLGDEAAAATSFDQAQLQLNDPLTFYLSRSQLHLRGSQAEKAESDAQAAIDLNAKSAAAWLLLAQALEIQNKLTEAISAYQKASELATASGDSEVVVLARMALGRIGTTP